MRYNPDHDYDDPAGEAKAARALAVVEEMPSCDACTVEHTVVPGPGTAWDIETEHESDCPEHPYNAKAVDVYLGDDFGDGAQVTLEAMWQMDAHDPRPGE